MTLTDIREYLQNGNGASLKEIAGHFGAEPAQVQSMLGLWIAKGRVVVRLSEGHGKTCCGKCGGAGHTRYEWVA